MFVKFGFKYQTHTQNYVKNLKHILYFKNFVIESRICFY